MKKNNFNIVKIDKSKSLFNYEKKILINELILDLKLGYYDFEKEKPQKVKFSLEIDYEDKKPTNDKDIKSIVNYGTVVKLITKLVKKKHYNFLETLAEAVFDELFKDKRIAKIMLKIEKIGYETKRYPIVINEGKTVDISGMTMDYDPTDKKDLYTISISDDNLNSEDDGLTDNISGLLQASRDVFLSAAAFDFSATFFRPRGLDNANGKVLINGIEMNKQFNGRPQWGNWGGVNDVQRNQEFTMGMSANEQEQNILIEFQQGIIEKLQEDVEKLKDKQRAFSNGDHQ